MYMCGATVFVGSISATLYKRRADSREPATTKARAIGTVDDEELAEASVAPAAAELVGSRGTSLQQGGSVSVGEHITYVL
jgi:hypothetical protein